MKYFFKVLFGGIALFLALSVTAVFFWFFETEFTTVHGIRSAVVQACQVGLMKMPRLFFMSFLLVSLHFFKSPKSERRGIIPFFLISYGFLLFSYWMAAHYYPLSDVETLKTFVIAGKDRLAEAVLEFDTLIAERLYSLRNMNFALFALYWLVVWIYLLLFVRLEHVFAWKQLNFLFGVVLFCGAVYSITLLLGGGSAFLLGKMPFLKAEAAVEAGLMAAVSLIGHGVLSAVNRKYEVFYEA